MSDEITAVILKELREFRTETNSRFNGCNTTARSRRITKEIK